MYCWVASNFRCSSFTLEKVRRLIEEDLELEKHALDVHKRFIKQSLEKVISLVS